MATCDDADGSQLRQLTFPMLGPGDATYNQRDGYVYYREALSDAHGNVERISRVALTGGVPQLLVQGPSMANETEVSTWSAVRRTRTCSTSSPTRPRRSPARGGR